MTREEELLAQLRELPKEWRKAKALLGAEPFGELVGLYAERSAEALVELATEGEAVAACAALEALSRRPRDQEVADGLEEFVGPVRPQTAVFLLRALDVHMGEGLVYRILTWGGPAWGKAPFKDLRALIARRQEAFVLGPVPEAHLESQLRLIRRLGDVLPPGTARPLEERLAVRGALAGLSDIGRTWAPVAARGSTATCSSTRRSRPRSTSSRRAFCRAGRCSWSASPGRAAAPVCARWRRGSRAGTGACSRPGRPRSTRARPTSASSRAACAS